MITTESKTHNSITVKNRLEEINSEMESKKLTDTELDALLDEVQEISAKERKNIDDLLKPYKSKFLWKYVALRIAYSFIGLTVGIHVVKALWYFVTFNWNLW